MVRYSIDELTEDMILGESIFLPTGELLLAAGFKIKDRYKDRLRELGYKSVLVEVEGTEEAHPEAVVSEEIQRKMYQEIESTSRNLSSTIKEIHKHSEEEIKNILHQNRAYLNKFILNTGMTKTLQEFIDEIMGQSSLVLNLSALKKANDSLLSHSLNVTITSLCIGRKYRFPYNELKELGIGALNFDLGLVALPKKLLQKNMSDFDAEEARIYKQHTIIGFMMLSQNHSVPVTGAAVALQHHERENGSGYPQGLTGDNRPPLKDFSRKHLIHRFAQIVAVAEVYDMFISGRPREKIEPMPAKDAIRKIIQMSGTELNSDIVKTLCTMVPLYPVGTRVRITRSPHSQMDGYYGVVAKDNPDNLECPQVIIYETKNHQKIKPVLIDFSKHSGYGIELLV